MKKKKKRKSSDERVNTTTGMLNEARINVQNEWPMGRCAKEVKQVNAGHNMQFGYNSQRLICVQ